MTFSAISHAVTLPPHIRTPCISGNTILFDELIFIPAIHIFKDFLKYNMNKNRNT
jgi:hypothetical protein